MTQTLPDDTGRTQPPAISSPRGGRLDRFRRDNIYLLPVLPLSVVGYTAVVVATSLSVSLLAVAIGLPLLALSLRLARGLTAVERLRLRSLGMDIPDAPAVVHRKGWQGFLDAARDRRSWQAVLHAVVTCPVAVATWSMAVGWWATALGGLSYPLWRGALPDGPDDQNLTELLGFASTRADIALHVGVGLLFAITLVPAVRGLAGVQSGLSRAILAPELVGRRGVQ